MLEKATHFDRGSSLPLGSSADASPPPRDIARFDKAASKGSRKPKALIHLMVRLQRTARIALPITKRISLLRELQPEVAKVTDRLAKPVVFARQSSAGTPAGQPLVQHLNVLMIKNLKLALDDVGYSDLTSSEASVRLRLWLVRSMFYYLVRAVEYAVHCDTPYPSAIWSTAHELYSDLVTWGTAALGIESRGGNAGFDPQIEYKRLLLLGVTRQLIPVAERSPRLLAGLTSMAKESRLLLSSSYCGAFNLIVVEIFRDEPPYLSAGIEQGHNGWVFEPAKEFWRLVGKN
jgi:hypothetical protein